VFRSYSAQRGAINCEGHDYVARGQLNLMRMPSNNVLTVRHIELRWTGPGGTFALKKITLLNPETGASMPVSPLAGSLSDTTRWRQVGEIDVANSGYEANVKAEDVGASVLFENLRVRPRAWLVPEVRSLPADAVFNAIRSSRLPDGRVFDPARVALVEGPFSFKANDTDTNPTAQVVRLSAREMQVNTVSTAPAFLVTSDVFYPGWRATVDGVPVSLYQTDYALRGLPVPAGTHVVRFEFRPRSLYFGAGVSALSLLVLVGYALWSLKSRNER
jgi:hypothetical protein